MSTGDDKKDEEVLDKRELTFFRKAVKDHFDENYNTYKDVSRSLNSSIKYRNLHKIDMDLIFDHGERDY